jgi:hypothetical protein
MRRHEALNRVCFGVGCRYCAMTQEIHVRDVRPFCFINFLVEEIVDLCLL